MNCQCPSCDADSAHKPSKCRRKARWYIEYHPVDRCRDVEARKINVCQKCFDAYVNLAKRTIASGMESIRAAICKQCCTPLLRLSSIIRDVGKV